MALRTMIVGCGAVAQRLYRKPLQQLTKRRLLRVDALVDPIAEHAQALGSFFPDAVRYAGLDDALHAEALAALHEVPRLDRAQVRRRFEERFSAARMARDYLSVYRSLAGRKDRAA